MVEEVEEEPRSKSATSIELCHSGEGELRSLYPWQPRRTELGENDLGLGRRVEEKEEGGGVF